MWWEHYNLILNNLHHIYYDEAFQDIASNVGYIENVVDFFSTLFIIASSF